MPERITPEFYCREADRLLRLAALERIPQARLKLLEMAANFRETVDKIAAANSAARAARTKAERE